MRPLIVIFALCLASCSTTVVPGIVQSARPGYDGLNENSGVLGVANGQFVVTAGFRARYVALTGVYRKSFSPAAEVVTTARDDGNFLIDPQHMQQFLLMQAWARSGIKPR